MLVPNRNYSSPEYRYGFNGMEKDDNIKGNNNSYDFGARMYDPRIGRWFSVDKQESKYPEQSPYVFVSDSPLLRIDPDGNTDINIHIVRVYNDGDTMISIVQVEIAGEKSFYASVTNPETSYAPQGDYYGYLLNRSDNSNKKDESHADSQTFTKRIVEVSNTMVLVDERLPKQFQKGGVNYGGHNGIRIFEPGMTGKQMASGWYRLEGGNRFIHVANTASEVIGCEGFGNHTGKPYGVYGVVQSSDAVGKLLERIISTYENDIKKGEETTKINIKIEDNIQANINEYDIISPEKLYKDLYRPRKLIKPISVPETKEIDIKSLIKPIKIEDISRLKSNN